MKRFVETELNYTFLFHQPVIMMFCFFPTQTDVQSQLSSEVTGYGQQYICESYVREKLDVNCGQWRDWIAK